MLATRWQPFSEMWSEMNRISQELSQAYGEDGASRSRGAYPGVNVWDDEDKVYVEAELPGVVLEDLEIFVHDNQLSIQGERKRPEVENVSWYRRERPHGKFTRALKLPVEVNAQQVTAAFQDGVLLVELPKREEVKPRRIDVKTA